MRKTLNTSASTYDQIIRFNYMYVDKTDYLYKLIKIQSGQYFLSRPRRFGKSMTLSALKAIFEGKKESFKDQYIYDKPYDWKAYPIIHLSMNTMRADTAENYERRLSKSLDVIAKNYNLTLDVGSSADKFEELILALSKKENDVVVLIDEYDKPILDNVLDLQKCTEIRSILKSFYGQIKANEDKLRFTFITGVSKFTQVSIFSDMNNLEDITMDRKFAGICGFTQEECEKYFAEWITENIEELETTKTAYLAKLKDMYDGIRFTPKKLYLYNPVSFTNAMKNCNFVNYWVQTGTPTFLMNLLKKDYQNNFKDKVDISSFENLKAKSYMFSSYEIDDLGIIPLFYQTGYLTIKDYNIEKDEYILSYPNNEVKESILIRFVELFSKSNRDKIGIMLIKLFDTLEENNMDEFMNTLKVYYANIDYDIQKKDEECYQLIFYLLFSNLNFRINTEVKTNRGRMDAVIETPDRIFIFEFKLDKTAQVAMDQIKDREYYQKYLLAGKELILVGANFDSKKANIGDWIVKKI